MADKITIFSSSDCSGCQDLESEIKKLNLKVRVIDITKNDRNFNIAKKLGIIGVPTAVINGEKFAIFTNGKCLIFKNRKKTVRNCK